jgi:hypothetical protein
MTSTATSAAAFVTQFVIAALTAAERLGNRPDECSCCDRAGLVHIVKLRHADGGIVWMGTGCAAKALYGPRVQVTAAVRNQMSNDEHAARIALEVIEERRERYGRVLAAFLADDDIVVLESGCRRTYHQLGGSAVLGKFPAWLAAVAETGDLDATAV